MSLYSKKEDIYKKNITRYIFVVIIVMIAFTIAIMNDSQDGELQVNSKNGLTQANDNTVYTNAKGTDEDMEVMNEDTDKIDYSNKNAVDNTVANRSNNQKKQGDLVIKNTTDTNSTKTNSIIYEDNQDTDQPSKKIVKDVEERLNSMTLEEKICQMFIVSPEELTNYFNVTAAGIKTKRAINRYPVGGVIYLASNLQNESQTKKLLLNTNTYATENDGIPMFLCVDEEGGQVTRIASNKNFKVERFDNMTYVTSKEESYKIGSTIGSYLKKLGFNVDFAPVADVLTNKKNKVVRERSFGSNALKVADYAYEVAKGLNDQGMYTTYKHFPGHGSTAEDSHEGFAITHKSYEKLYEEDFVPFLAGIEKNIDFIMVGHISAPKVIGDNTPSSLSKVMVTDILREKLNYTGVIITDAMNMGAISKNYTVEQSTVQAVKAGCDIVLMPADFRKAYSSLLKAVNEGEISKKQIDESVRRILILKKRRLEF